jgi:hypothetical protein
MLVDQTRELLLYIDVDDHHMSVILAHSITEVCGMAGRALLPTEA